MTERDGVDVVIEAVGSAATLTNALEVVRKRGRVVSVGRTRLRNGHFRSPAVSRTRSPCRSRSATPSGSARDLWAHSFRCSRPDRRDRGARIACGRSACLRGFCAPKPSQSGDRQSALSSAADRTHIFHRAKTRPAPVAKYLYTGADSGIILNNNYKHMEPMWEPCQQSPREVCALKSSAVAVEQFETGAIASPLSLEEAIRLLTAAADHGYQFLFATAERNFFRIAAASSARTLTHSGGSWRPWDHLDTPDGLDGALGDLPTELSSWTATTRVGSRLFVPVRSGSVAMLIEDPRLDDAKLSEIGSMAAAVDLALTACEWRQATTDNLDGLRALQRVATRILKSHDLEEILLLVTHEAKRHLRPTRPHHAARGRCRRHAPVRRQLFHRHRVAAHAARPRHCRPCIRQARVVPRRGLRQEQNHQPRLFQLARTEMVRSALAAPLLSQSEVIGVLEVWRRRPSTFTERDTGRLEVLANLTSLAIENAAPRRPAKPCCARVGRNQQRAQGAIRGDP